MIRITRVHADAFGAMAGRTLELGPGLNVIVGPNESGKSTWHAALFAALCGLPPRSDWSPADQRFAAFRRPRDRSDWAVRAELDLVGPTATRRIALAHNLLDPQASTVADMDSGDDVSAEICVKDGPDAARWLGFDRRSYAATSWIEQAGARGALVSTDGRNALQLAVAACVREDEVDAALAQIEAARRDYVGGSTGIGAHATAVAAVRRWQADRAAAEELARARRDAMTRLASATGAAEIARKKLLAAKAFEARAEADRLRALVVQPGDPAAEEPPRHAGPTVDADRESMRDVEVHSTVVLAEMELRAVEQAIADLAEGRTGGWRRLADGDEPDADEPIADEAGDDHRQSDDDDPAEAPAEGPRAQREHGGAARRPWTALRLPTLDRVPGLDRVWGLHRLPGLGWVRRLSRNTLLGIGAAAGLAVVVGVVLAIALQSIAALVTALVAALLLLAAVVELTPSPAARSAQSTGGPGPAPRPTGRPARPAQVRAGRPAVAPAQSTMTADLRLRHNVALTKLAAALIARGRRAHPVTAVADYERYVLDCADVAELRALADLAVEQRRAREQDAQQAREEVAERAERLAEECEQAADPYDLGLPYRHSVADAQRDRETAERDLGVATAAMAGIDARIRAHPSLAVIEEGTVRAEAVVARVERLDRVLQRTYTELTLARETVLRDIATGLTPRLTDYLAQFTDRPFSTADTHDLQDQIGASLLRREPELGSFSTSESTFLFTRIALGQHLAGDAPQGPLLLDDITSSADTERIRRMLAILRRISVQRQVVVFAHQSQVRTWALKRIGKDPGLRLIRLTSIAEDPQRVPPPREPRQVRQSATSSGDAVRPNQAAPESASSMKPDPASHRPSVRNEPDA